MGAVGVLARDTGVRAYLVGGLVRDVLTGYGKLDLDITVEGDGVTLARTFAARTGSLLEGPTEFGTCKVKSGAFGTADFATARRETYDHAGALPRVEESDIREDLYRRDFTMNAMAVSLDPKNFGRLIDPFRGFDDLGRKRLRVLHDRSFEDDPTRILRGVRFAARYGFAFDRKTMRLLRACVREACLKSVSGKRIYADLRLICMEPSVIGALRMLERYKILASIDAALALGPAGLDHLRRLPKAIDAVDGAAHPGYAARWLSYLSSLFVGCRAKTAERLLGSLNPPKEVRRVCLWVAGRLPQSAARLGRLGPGQPYEITRLLGNVPPEGLLHLYAASGRRSRSLIVRYLAAWRHVTPELSGRDIADMGAGEAPIVGLLLERLLKLKLEGRIVTRFDEINYVHDTLTRRRRRQSALKT